MITVGISSINKPYPVGVNLQIGRYVYVDRGYTYTTVPSLVQGASYIQTANNDKALGVEDFMTFTLAQSCLVYVAHDIRLTAKPTWLNAFSNTGVDIVTSDTTLRIYVKLFDAGPVSLGGNAASFGSMYTVILMPNSSSPLPSSGLPFSPERMALRESVGMVSTSVRLEDAGDEPANGDWTTHKDQALAYIATFPQGGRLQLEAKTYWIPEGITEGISGLEVVGTGHGAGGPGVIDQYGTVIKVTEAGAWCWKHVNPNPQYSRYHGPKLANFTIIGNHQTAGGLWTQVAFTSIRDLFIHRNTGEGSIGLKVDPAAGGPANDASWVKITDVHIQDCWHSAQFTGTDAGCEVKGLTTLKVGNGGIVGQGTGVTTTVGNIRIVASKTEGNATGWNILSRSGVELIGCDSEGEGISFHLNRPPASFTSQIMLLGCGSKGSPTWLKIGPNNWADVINLTKWEGVLDDQGLNTRFLP